MSRIVKLFASNVKRIKAVSVELPPDEHVVVVRGNNGHGKSSFIDTVQYALGGKSTHPPRVIRDGTTRAEVVLETDEIKAVRKWDEKGTTLEVFDRAGTPLKSPQATLERLVGRLSFDPLAFLQLDPKKQLEALKDLVKLDLSKIENEHAKVYADRVVANKAMSELLGQLAAVRDVPEVQKVDTGALIAAIGILQNQRAEILSEQKAFELKQGELNRARAERESLQKRIAALDERIEVLTVEVEELDPPVTTIIDANLNEQKQKLADSESINEGARRYAERMKLEERVQKGQGIINDMSERLRVLQNEKEAAIEAVQMPVPGLGFGVDGVLYKGVPLEQASGAERLRVSVGMGLALNPKLRVLLVRDGSLLDENSFKLLQQMAEEFDAQVFIEMVGNEGDGIVIEEGEVRNAEQYAPAPEAEKPNPFDSEV